MSLTTLIIIIIFSERDLIETIFQKFWRN